MTHVYQVKKSENGTFANIETMFDGLRILKLDGLLAKGKAVNIYTAQWIGSQSEDFMITTRDNNNNPVVIRENVDLTVTFIISHRYANGAMDVLSTHDSFIEYMTSGDLWIKSSYTGNKYVHCVCLNEYKPTTVRLQREDAYVLGTITLHCLDAPIS